MKTELYESHVALGGKMVDFAGWEMPIQYEGIIAEHQAVRESVGIFDVSHMGRVLIQGRDAERLLDFLSVSEISKKPDLTATYTVWCNENGGCVDDLIVYKFSSRDYFVVVNASNREKDLAHILKNTHGFEVQITDRYQQEGILAIQGPRAKEVVGSLFPKAVLIKPMHLLPLKYLGDEVIVASTGYTGSGGYEIFSSHATIHKLWDIFIERGVKPIGLGARDTLRLEMGYALYGHEISETICPNESVSAWTIKGDKKDFLGKKALEKIEKNKDKRSEFGIILQGPGIAREGYEVFFDGKKIGSVTSGTFSPSLNQSIALILVNEPLYEGDLVDVQIRKNQVKGKVVKLPFYTKRAQP